MGARVALHELDKLSVAQRDTLLRRTESDLSSYVEAVGPIIDAVRERGDAALIEFARTYDRATVAPGAIKAKDADFERAFAETDPAVIQAIEYGIDGIRRFHEAQMPQQMWMQEVRPGAFAGERTTAIPSVACYVPRGKGSFPSVAMMTTVPAVVTGVGRIVIITPPGPDGEVDAGTLVAARLAGVSEVYKCGGAQGIAAVAYGTETVPRVVKVVGPGSPWVAAAQRLLANVIEPGIPAGPSEAIVLADGSANGRIGALDLIVESEHGPDSSAFLVTDSAEVAADAQQAIPEFWADMGAQRVEYSSIVLGGESGGIVLAPDLDAAIAFVNDYAPEHLEILSREPLSLLGRIDHAGEILLGEHTPFPLGNFVLGPNAVLPTAGAAKTRSALSVHDFQKRTSIGLVTEAGYPELARHANILATYEGFDGHANAVSGRRDVVRRRN